MTRLLNTAHHRALGDYRRFLVDRHRGRTVDDVLPKNAARFLGRRVIADQPENSEPNRRAKDAALRRHRSFPPGRITRDRSRLAGRRNDSTPVAPRLRWQQWRARSLAILATAYSATSPLQSPDRARHGPRRSAILPVVSPFIVVTAIFLTAETGTAQRGTIVAPSPRTGLERVLTSSRTSASERRCVTFRGESWPRS